MSDCSSIACISLINVIFSREYQLKIPPFCHICLYFFVCSGSDFCWNFRVIWEVSKKSLLERYINFPLCVFKPKSKKNRQINRMENLSRNFFKKNTHEIEFLTQFSIEFLQQFTGCREVLGKMADY